MVEADRGLVGRRMFLAGAAASGLMVLPGCATTSQLSLVEVIRRLLMRASSNALARLAAPGGFWDNQLARLDLPDIFGSRGATLQGILTSVVLKDRLRRGLNHIAERGAERAAPIIADTVRTIGVENAAALIRGGPTAATGFLRGAMGGSLVEAMVPPLGDALRVAEDPVVAQALAGLAGVDIASVARSLAAQADEAIWGEIGREEAAIRADPEATNDPVLIAGLRLL